MLPTITDGFDGLSECIAQAIREHLSNANHKRPLDLHPPLLRVEVFQEPSSDDASDCVHRSKRIASCTVDLGEIVPLKRARINNTNLSQVEEPRYQSASLRSEQDSGSTRIEDPNESALTQPNGASRKGTGGLRISQAQECQIPEDTSEHQRQIQSDNRNFPKRRKITSEKFSLQPSTLDKLIVGIWEQIHGPLNLDPRAILEQFQVAPVSGNDAMYMDALSTSTIKTMDSFKKMNIFCCKVTQASRVGRSIEIIVQARWVELFEEQVQLRIVANPELSVTKHRKAALMEASQDFGWSEKELRNKMTIWRGYKEIKDSAGYAALIFSGMGIYRFCKYRIGFDKDAMRRFQNLQNRLEVAADTLHPTWRQILSIVGESTKHRFTGHPHDWIVFEDGLEPVPLRSTYVQYDPHFAFEHVDESIIDESAWGCDDPRWAPQSKALRHTTNAFSCAACGEQQSDDPKWNSCYCFPTLFGCAKRSLPPVQVFRTPDGRNNGLQALISFERGMAIGEFVGLVTKGVRHLDVMDSSTSLSSYQIWQGRQGNFTRFVNHSCKANAQFSQFTWLDTQRVVLVSKGVEAGREIFVDYGDRYWAGLDKSCLCGENCCRYKRRG